MVICKAPVWGLGRASTKLPRLDSTSSAVEKTFTSQLHTTACLNALNVHRASSDAKARQRAERDQLTRLLKESDAKRDARNYIKHFDVAKKAPGEAASKARQAVSAYSDPATALTGVNLGNLYEPTVFTHQQLPEERFKESEEEPIHLALVKIRQPQALDDVTLGGIASTLSQLAQLGLSTAVVLDCDDDASCDTAHARPPLEQTIRRQATRMVAALQRHNEPGALLVEHALSSASLGGEGLSTAHVRGDVEVKDNYLLFPPIDDGVIPVIPPFAFDADLKRVTVLADDVVLALVREFAGLSGGTSSGIEGTAHSHQHVYDRPILDRIIILDPLGGIPSENRADGAHVFVNLEAEYRDIKEELAKVSSDAKGAAAEKYTASPGSGNPIADIFADEVASTPGPPNNSIGDILPPDRHTKNLNVVERALKLLPPSSSGLILTPIEAATESLPAADSSGRRPTPSPNPLIHNVLTDKPMVSSSLPTSPLSRLHSSHAPNPSTFLKKGIPLTMIPDPRICGPWQPPSTGYPIIDLANDPRINLPKLVDLINDSFRRKLDPKDYLKRIEGRVAGIIIAGDYEGGAICTWETPSTLRQHGSGAQAHAGELDSPHWVPYLDKFAVLTSSQGSGGVSDIVWAALVRTCFPRGVVWRSRTSNPVNKWYQERSTGMWNLPGGQWTMFWTVEGVTAGWGGKDGRPMEMKRWDAYVDVCSGIEPSWLDSKK
ncbi:mitochondrial amino-acid acetyltransferase [Didymella exigua CBS 183.55]|uniref:Amino-acid acetyltransferase, mitochondrial n=1 Tax=Didymella exigua CBS 183.55 TaxID=1150837 RepID=A0A6A5RH34_9PLEO|nr:mitochondrial amino-acid acetyltransferase [Didymella exigua CBS 183.55]KAF1926394.1 mitochondrial amino-acid acetyltransferase [Didymella exigua CBS 183.55]